jgi:hypothetical protein
MRKLYIRFVVAGLLSVQFVQGQTDPAVMKQLVTESSKEKTLSSWDVLGLLYQMGANDVTADNKSVTFKSTIFGIRKVFDKSIDNSDSYRRLWFDRYFEPKLGFDYKNNFNPSNLSAGFNFSFINANDVSSAAIFNDAGTAVAKYTKALDDGPLSQLDHQILQALDAAYPGNFKTQKAIMNNIVEARAKFIVSGDPTSMKGITLPDGRSLTAVLQGTPANDIQGNKTTLYDAFLWLASYYGTALTRVKNKWNVVFSPTATYAFYAGSFQGYEFALKSIKGFKVFKDSTRTSQLLASGSLKIGDDTIISPIRTNRRQITDQVGFSQVIFTKKSTDDKSGVTSQVPFVEASLTGGCNWVMSGLASGEKAAQPTLKAKLGLMIGKNCWLVVPFTYNFTTKSGQGSISVTVNLGDPPFKSGS